MDQLSSAGNQSQKHTEPTQGGGRRRNKWARLTAADCRPSTKAARRTPWNKLLCKWKEQQRLATQKSEQPITISKQIIVITDKNDYSPGEVVRITATGITPGGTALFSIADDASDPGADGNADDYGSFLVSDGSSEDLDREVNGKIVASWIVPTDNNGSGSGIPDALDATLRLTTQEVGAGSDGIFGTPDDINIGSSQVTSFTDGAAIITKTGVSITLDETTGLQNQATTPSSASDANDNDIASSSLPSALATRLSQLGVNPANLLGAALSGYTGTNTGLDSFTLSAAGGGLDLTFTDQSGLILNGRDSGLTTVDNNKIYLFTDSGSGSNNNLVLGRVGTSAENARNGAIAFAAYIEETPTGGKIWTIENSPLRHPNPQESDEGINLANQLYLGSTTQDSNFSFSKAPSGQNLFLMLGSTGSQSGRKAGIVITGMNPADQSTGVSISKGDTVNTSQGGGGTTIGINNQMIDPKAANKPLEGTYITFVTDPVSNYTVPNLDQNEADLEKNIQFGGMLNTRAAAFTISQTQPAGKASTMRLTARFTADGSTPDGNGTTIEQGVNFIDTTKGGEKGGGLLDDKTVSITGVIVRNASGAVLNNAVADPSNHTKVFDANGVQIQFNYDTNGTVLSATITGVKTQYSIEYSTTGDHNRLLIENIGNSNANLNSSFDLGSFRVLQAGCVSPVEIGSQICFEDDAPSGTITIKPGVFLATDESAGANTLPTGYGSETAPAGTLGQQTVAFASLVNNGLTPGNDGLGSTSFTLTITEGANSGLKTPDGLQNIVLHLNGAVVEGRVQASTGALVFTLGIDAATGAATLTQFLAVQHTPNGGANDFTGGLAPGTVLLNATIVDKDGDSRTQSVDLGSVVRFVDDTPDAVNDSTAQSQENLPILINVFSNDSQGADGVNQLNAIALVPGSLNGTGSLVYNGDGTFTYTPFNGETGTVSFQYTITDQDGDLDTATASITLAADSTPTISVLDNSSPKPQPGLIDAVVSEGGLPNGHIKGPITDSGSFEIGLGSDSLDTLKITAGSNTIDVTAGTGITVQGAYGFLTVNLVNGIYTWSYTLTSTTTDILGQNETDSFIVTVTDNNGDTASDNLVVNILDDTPDATLTDTNGSPKLTVDDSDFNTDASGNFAAEFTSTKQYGADGLGSFGTIYSLGINSGGTGLIDTASNEAVVLKINGGIVEGRTAGSNELVFTVIVDSNASITLGQKRALKHPNSSENNESITLSSADLVTLTRTDTITDSDGDTNIATATINIGQDLLFLDDAPAGTVTLKSGAILATDESAGANPLPGGFGSETAPAGTLGQQTIAYTSLINDSLTPGNDGLGSKSFSLAITEGANTALKTADGLPIVLHLNGSVVEGRVQTTTGALAFTLAVDAVTGAATLTQYLAAQHSPNGGADDIAGGLTAGTVLLNTTIIDKDGDSRTHSVDLGSVVRFIDDAPSLHSFAGNQNVIIDAPYTPSSTPVIYSGINIGSWSVGSDGLAASTPFTISGLPAGYTPTTPVINGSTVTFSILYQGIKVADFELNAAAANDDTLKIYQIPGTIVEGTIDGSAATAGGPGTYYVELPTADVVAVVSGKNPDGTEGTVNASNQGWAGGDGDQNMEDGETITFTFQDYDKNEPNNTGGPDFVTAFSFDAQKFTGNGNNPTLQITVVYADGTTTKQFSPVSIPNGVTSYPFTINQFGLSAGGTLVQDFANSSGIRAVTILDVVDGSQTFNINGVKISGYSETRPDLNPNFNLTITDRDGDSSTLSVKLNLDGNDTGTNDPTVLKITAAPIVLDMSGNGIQYTDLAHSKANFDYGADGSAERTAWITGGSALLVYDHNHDGMANNGSEISFLSYAPDAMTDLEALRLAFDSNHDGVFNAQDLQFADFGVWMDPNGNGTTDSGEFLTLTEAGITSIKLSSDGVSTAAANGDVLIHGNTTFTLADGSVHAAQDVSFSTQLTTDPATPAVLAQPVALTTMDQETPAPLTPIPPEQATASSDQEPVELVSSPSQALPAPEPCAQPSESDAISGCHTDTTWALGSADLPGAPDHGAWDPIVGGLQQWLRDSMHPIPYPFKNDVINQVFDSFEHPPTCDLLGTYAALIGENRSESGCIHGALHGTDLLQLNTTVSSTFGF